MGLDALQPTVFCIAFDHLPRADRMNVVGAWIMVATATKAGENPPSLRASALNQRLYGRTDRGPSRVVVSVGVKDNDMSDLDRVTNCIVWVAVSTLIAGLIGGLSVWWFQ
jgi:hypothetical protein